MGDSWGIFVSHLQILLALIEILLSYDCKLSVTFRECVQANIDVQIVATDIETRVTSLDGVRIREVWCEERFYDSFYFDEGLVPTPTSNKLNFLLIAKPAIKAKAKFASVYLFAPGQVGQGY